MAESITARFNYTGRQRIELSTASVVLQEDGESLAIVLNVLDPDHFAAYPPDARVVVNLTRRTTVERVDFGSIAHLRSPDQRTSTLFTDPTGVRATIKVVSIEPNSRGLLLGASTAMSATHAESDDDTPLLLFQRSDLGGRLWCMDFDDPTPTVLINSKIDDWEGEVHDLRFQALVFPEIARQIAVWSAGEDDDDENPVAKNWRKFFARQGAPTSPPGSSDSEEIAEWAERCADALATRQNFAIRYLELVEAEAGS